MDDGVAATLQVLDASFPAVETMTPAEARSAIASRQRRAGAGDEVVAAWDRRLAGPGGDIPVRIYHPHTETDAGWAAVVFLHGGGFVFCDIDSHDEFCRAMCAGTAAAVISVGYRLAPEHPAPAAAEDAVAAYCWTIEHAAELAVDRSRVVIAGDSAGANLAAVAAILCRERGLPMPKAQALWYPVIDPRCDTASYRRYAMGFVNTRAAMQWYWRNYLGGYQLPEPAHLVAPARAATHAGLPPALVFTAELDPLHDEGAGYADTLRRAGVAVVHRDFPGLFHGFLTLMDFPPAAAARDLLWSDLRALLAAALPEAAR